MTATTHDPNVRDQVVARIRDSLPEFAERNGIVIPDTVMDNLAYWVTGVVPSGTYREWCPNRPEPCACIGACQPWRRVNPPD